MMTTTPPERQKRLGADAPHDVGWVMSRSRQCWSGLLAGYFPKEVNLHQSCPKGTGGQADKTRIAGDSPGLWEQTEQWQSAEMWATVIPVVKGMNINYTCRVITGLRGVRTQERNFQPLTKTATYYSTGAQRPTEGNQHSYSVFPS